MEPSNKRMKVDDQDLKEMISNMQFAFFNKLKSIEEKIEKICSKYHLLEEKVEAILCNLQGIPVSQPSTSISSIAEDSAVSLNVPTNIINDYPDGSWLGDPDNIDFRIRCHISPKDLDNINRCCSTPEKMSLTLLDYLFDREIQACSNLSGTGKHGKRQLDPFKIFGIKCHVTHMFGITEDDWNRIKLNIDSKCRTAFRRKLKGMPLNVRGAKGRPLYTLKKDDDISDDISDLDNSASANNESLNSPEESMTKKEPESQETGENENLTSSVKIMSPGAITFPEAFKPQIIHAERGRIQVIRATKEQFEQLKQNHQFQILSRTNILPN